MIFVVIVISDTFIDISHSLFHVPGHSWEAKKSSYLGSVTALTMLLDPRQDTWFQAVHMKTALVNITVYKVQITST